MFGADIKILEDDTVVCMMCLRRARETFSLPPTAKVMIFFLPHVWPCPLWLRLCLSCFSAKKP